MADSDNTSDNGTRHKSFHSPVPPDAPITFDLEGTTFTCRPAIINGWNLMRTHERFIRNSRDGLINMDDISDFFSQCMEPDEHTRFMAFLEDPGRYIEAQTVVDLFTWLYGEFAGGRPTKPSSPSATGRSTTPRTLRDVESKAESA